MTPAEAQEVAYQRDKPTREGNVVSPLMKEICSLEATIYKLGHIQGFYAAIDYVNQLNTPKGETL